MGFHFRTGSPRMVLPFPYGGSDGRHGYAGHADVRIRQLDLSALILLFLMWTVMMVAMMVPSAVPMIQGFVAVNERRRNASRPVIPVGVFVLGYIVAWTSFSAAAALAQWGLHRAALLSP